MAAGLLNSDEVKFCGACGGAMTSRRVAGESVDRPVCVACGWVQYTNPTIIVAAIVTCQKHLLVCMRTIPAEPDGWVLPSGFLEVGETLQEGAARETVEETAVVIDSAKLELYSIVNMPQLRQVAVAFRTDLASFPPTAAGPECTAVRFLPISELKPESFAWNQSMGDSVATLFAEIENGRFNIHLVTLGLADGSRFTSRRYRIS